ncbi:MAG TPA: protease pro-enzyme activation domain-containing protein [Verrucomicrobiae bacterium]
MKISLCALLAIALPGVVAAQQMKTLGGHVPRAVSYLHLQPVGELPAGTNLTLAISLPVQNQPGLDALLGQIYDPSSTNYHHYLKSGEFTRQFGPSAADYQKVMDFAKANNLAIVRSWSNQMLLDVSGKASDIEKTFHVKLRTYRHPYENRMFYAPDTDPTVDSSTPIAHVSGLDNYLIPRPAFVKQGSPAGTPVRTKPGAGSGPGGTYMGMDFRAAYAPGVRLDGKGQNVALYELDGYFTADILSYESQAGLPSLTLTNISVNGGVPNPTPFGDPEVSLDIEMVISMATNASEVMVYEAPNGVANSVVDLLNRIASDDLANQISSSWLIGDDPSYDVYYKQMALQGQSFFQASGDNGAFWTNLEQDQQWADDTNITLVGGTTLSTAGPVGAWTSETVWNWFSEGIGTDGSGGGTNWNGIAIPSWQQSVPMTNNMGSTTLRNVPDVSLTADAVYVVYENGQSGYFGGTSCAAPLWAAYTALVNEQATNRDLPPVGFLNPAIYAIGLSANYTNCFHDITTGNDTNSVVGNKYFAVPGYDLATGWGTPNGSNLINALTASASVTIFTHLSPPPPPYGSTLNALNISNPNGNWELFVLDDQGFNSGGITNGWVLSLTTANPIGFVADDDLTMTASATNVLTNSVVTFALGITNYGPNTSSNVVVLDNLPADFSFVSASATLGSVTNSGQTVTWNVTNSLAYSSGAQMTLKLQAPNAQEEAENSALVTPGTPDPNLADSSAFVIVNVTTPAPPLLSSVGMGNGGTFHLSVSNSSGLSVVVQSSTNLVNWVPIATNSASAFIYTDAVAPGFPTRFYRALVQ